MDSRFEKLKKIAIEEFGLQIKKVNQTMSFESIFGMDVRDLPDEATMFEEDYIEEQCLKIDIDDEYVWTCDHSALIAA